MDPATERALEAIDRAVAEVRRLPRGPLPLREDYLRAVEAVERLPMNQSGADKTWVWEAVERDRRHFARAVKR